MDLNYQKKRWHFLIYYCTWKSRTEVEDIFQCDDDAPMVNKLTNEEILTYAINLKANSSNTESKSNEEQA